MWRVLVAPVVAGAVTVLAAGGGPAAAAGSGARCGGLPTAIATAAGAGDTLRPSLAFDQQPNAGRRSPAGAVLRGIAVPVGAGEWARELRLRLSGFAGDRVTVFANAARLDRRDRVAGQVTVSQGGRALWLQGLLVAEGLAVVGDDAGECAGALLALETQARALGRGLHADPRVRVDLNGAAPEGLPGFVTATGRVVSVGVTEGTVWLNFGTDRRRDATVRLNRRNSAGFPSEKDPRGLAGSMLRIRGWGFDRDGLDLRVDDPHMIEIIEEQRDGR